MKNYKKRTSDIAYISMSEEEFLKKAQAQLEEIEERLKEVEKEKFATLHTIHIARLYYKLKKIK